MHPFHLMMKLPILLLLIFLLIRHFRNGGAVKGSGTVARVGAILLFVALLGFAGCANTDPLATASGPVFALNAGHWQPSPQDLTVPPLTQNQ
jgi:hypothetical protein